MANTAPKDHRTAPEQLPGICHRFVFLFTRGSLVSSLVGVFIILLATALATTLGVVASHALGVDGGGTASQAGSSSSSSTVTTTSLPAVLAAGPDQHGAPIFPVPGGEQPGYGNFNAVSCIDATTCVAAGADDAQNGVTSVSADGGQSWTSSTMPIGTPALDAISCRDVSNCLSVGQGVIASSTDGGSSWSLSAVPTANTTLLGTTCPTSTICLAVGVTENPTGPYAGAVVRSTDGGETWSTVTLPQGTAGIGDIACPTSTTCIAVGASVLESTDAGASWAVAAVSGGPGTLRTISCLSSTTCIAVGPNVQGATDPDAPADAVITTDGGTTWSQDSLPAGSASLEQISCTAATQCFAGGPSTTITGPAAFFSTSDAGSTWTESSSPPTGLSSIAGLSCPAANECAVVGRQADRQAATAASSDVTSWTTTTLPGDATPPATDAPLPAVGPS
jgi:photosystem II stability/assembly factor-like uncharacterized protein